MLCDVGTRKEKHHIMRWFNPSNFWNFSARNFRSSWISISHKEGIIRKVRERKDEKQKLLCYYIWPKTMCHILGKILAF